MEYATDLSSVGMCTFTVGVDIAATSSDEPTYVYDHRGLKVRKDSLSRVQPQQSDEGREKKNISGKL